MTDRFAEMIELLSQLPDPEPRRRQSQAGLISRERAKIYYQVRETLMPEACSTCQSTANVQAHHADYAKPLDVTWLCASCHRGLHEHERRTQRRGK